MTDFSNYMFGHSEAGSRLDEDPLAKHTNDNNLNKEDILKQEVKNQNIIFMTINPDPLKNVYRRHFSILLKKYAIYLKKVFKSENVKLHYRFERSEVAKLHAHCVIYNVPETFYPFEGTFATIQKYVHRDMGRAKVKHSVCCDMQWAGNNDSVIDYLYKGLKK